MKFVAEVMFSTWTEDTASVFKNDEDAKKLYDSLRPTSSMERAFIGTVKEMKGKKIIENKPVEVK